MHCYSEFNIIVIVPILTESDSSISANPSTTCVVKPEGMLYILLKQSPEYDHAVIIILLFIVV